MNDSLRIGLVTREYPPCKNGGVGTFAKELAEGLVKKGHKVVVFGIYHKNTLELLEPIKETINGVIVYRFPKKKTKWGSYIDDILERWEYRKIAKKLIKEYDLDLIESNDSIGQMAFIKHSKLITRLHGTVTYFGYELNRPFSRVTSFYERIQLEKSTLILSVSEYTWAKTKAYFRLKSKKHKVIYNSIADSRFLPQKQKFHREITYFGSIVPKKGAWVLCEAMNIVFQKYPDFQLNIIGKYSIEKRDSLLAPINQEFRNNVNLIEHLSYSDLQEKIEDSFCCVFPSFSECFSLTPMEAMALGIPVVYSTLHSGPELIDNGIDGLLANPHDIDDVANKILYLIEDEDRARRIGQLGQKKIQEKFGYEDWLQTNIDIYQKVKNSKL